MAARDRFLAARDFLRAHYSDPEGARAGFQWPELEHFNWALDYFDWYAGDNDRPALRLIRPDGSESGRTFEELRRRSNQVANRLRALGARRGDRLLIMLPNVVPLWELMLGAMKLGVVIIPATPQLTVADLADRLDRGQARHVVTDAEGAEKLARLAVPGARLATGEPPSGWHAYDEVTQASDDFVADGHTAAADPLLLYFTSGTTARPKLVLHTHTSYPVGHLSTMYWLGLEEDDLHLNISSPGWAKHAWSSFFAPWNAGATIAVFDTPRFDAAALLGLVERARITSLCAPPTVWRMVIGEDLGRYRPALRRAVSAGEPLNPEVIDRVERAWGLTIRDGYGQTETTAQVGNPPGAPIKPGAMGRPLPGYEIEVLGPDGAPAAEGELALRLEPRPLGLMAGYLDDPLHLAEAAHSGFYRTGDVVARDDQGYLTYVGRRDDVFKSADYRISPFELESVLIEHPAVAEAAVVESPDPIRLTVPKAFVTLRGGHAPGPELALDILRFVRERVAPFKRIRRLEFAELPKTISGKIRRVELRTREAEQVAAGRRSEGAFAEEDFAELHHH